MTNAIGSVNANVTFTRTWTLRTQQPLSLDSIQFDPIQPTQPTNRQARHTQGKAMHMHRQLKLERGHVASTSHAPSHHVRRG
jgi:hypothetical protein